MLHRLGCVLMQHDKVMAYGSRQLKDREKRYANHDLELATMVLALKCGGITCTMRNLKFLQIIEACGTYFHRRR